MSEGPAPDQRTSGARSGAASWTLFVLFTTNVFNVADRTLLGVVTEPVRLELALSDTEMSLANGLLFVLFNLVGGLFIARLVDRGNRKRILAIGLAGWSIATAATGLSHDFVTLSAARIGVGIGEATAFPAAMSLIPDLFRPAARGKAVAVFQSSNFLGVVGGTILAGVLAASLGWRAMFVVCGAGGVALAILLYLTVAEPERMDRSEPLPASKAWLRDVVDGCRRILAMPAFVPLALAFGISAMMGAVMGAWGPAFLQRSHGVPLAQVGLAIGPAVGIGGITGTLFSGVLADRLMVRYGSAVAMLRVPLFALPLAAPCMAGFVLLPSFGLAMLAAAAMNFMLSCAVAPCINFAVSSTAPSDRGLTSTLMLASSGLIGAGLGPFIVGVLSDILTPRYGADGLRYAIAAMVVTPLLSAAFLLVTIRKAREPGIPGAVAA